MLLVVSYVQSPSCLCISLQFALGCVSVTVGVPVVTVFNLYAL